VAVGRLSVAWRTGQSDAPSDTVRCASHVTRPLGFDCWSFCLLGHQTVRWCTGQSGGAPDMSYRLSGAPSGASLTSAHTVAHWMLLQATVGAEVAVATLAHRTVRWIIAERPPIFPKVASSASSSLVHRTVRCARPGCLWDVFSSLYLNQSLVFLLACCEPLAPVTLID
jgi:hypothetical protein